MTLSIEIDPALIEAITWLKDRPKTYRYNERAERLAIVQKFLDSLLQQAQSQNAT